MRNLLRRIRGALGMGVTWFVGGFLAGGLIELVHNIWPNPLGGAVDIWPMTLGLPLFVGGILFSFVLAVAGRRRRFDELSIPRFALWGAIGGVLESLFPAVMVGLGLASPNVPLWQITVSMAIPLSVASAVAASTTLWVARLAEDRELLEVSSEVAEVGLSEAERRELLG